MDQGLGDENPKVPTPSPDGSHSQEKGSGLANNQAAAPEAGKKRSDTMLVYSIDEWCKEMLRLQDTFDGSIEAGGSPHNPGSLYQVRKVQADLGAQVTANNAHRFH